jgi:hypothetical protein
MRERRGERDDDGAYELERSLIQPCSSNLRYGGGLDSCEIINRRESTSFLLSFKTSKSLML